MGFIKGILPWLCIIVVIAGLYSYNHRQPNSKHTTRSAAEVMESIDKYSEETITLLSYKYDLSIPIIKNIIQDYKYRHDPAVSTRPIEEIWTGYNVTIQSISSKYSISPRKAASIIISYKTLEEKNAESIDLASDGEEQLSQR